MLTNFSQIAFGMLLLWFPRRWMRVGYLVSQRRKSTTTEPWRRREPGDPRLSYEEFGKVRNYLDLFRAAIGGMAIVGSPLIDQARQVGDIAVRGGSGEVLAAQLAILTVGLLLQTLRRERGRMAFFAPIFYLAGLSVALCGHWAALFAFMMIWAINPMFGNAEAFLAAYGVLLVAFGILFRDTARVLVIAGGALTLVPVLLAMLTRRPLVVFTRKGASSSGG